MDSAKSQHGWKISDVERLVGLRRRDIQRACYQGRGGVGILSPSESSWGRRLYGQEDLLKLFLVKWERDRGLSLPEIKSLFDEVEAKEGGWDQFVEDQAARMQEDFEEAAWRLVCTEALRAATLDGEDALDDCIERILLIGAFELLDSKQMWTGEDGFGFAPENETGAEASATPLARCLVCLTRLSETDLRDLWSELEACRQQGLSADSAETQGVLAQALGFEGLVFRGAEESVAAEEALGGEEGAGAKPEGPQELGLRAGSEGPACEAAHPLDEAGLAGFEAPAAASSRAEAAETCEALNLLLDTPGMELALELKLGPGAFEYVKSSLDVFVRSGSETAAEDSGEAREGDAT